MDLCACVREEIAVDEIFPEDKEGQEKGRID
jgi:hypothetical protein